MNPMNTAHSDDEDVRGALPALIRAGKRARQIAAQTQTAVVYMKEGALVYEYPPASEAVGAVTVDKGDTMKNIGVAP